MVGLTNEAGLNTIIEIPALTLTAGVTSGTFVFNETSALAQTVTTIPIAAHAHPGRYARLSARVH